MDAATNTTFVPYFFCKGWATHLVLSNSSPPFVHYFDVADECGLMQRGGAVALAGFDVGCIALEADEIRLFDDRSRFARSAADLEPEAGVAAPANGASASRNPD